MEIRQHTAKMAYGGRIQERHASVSMSFQPGQTDIDIGFDGVTAMCSRVQFSSPADNAKKHRYTPEQLMDSGIDLLAGMVLRKGEPCWHSVGGLLPELELHAHGYLSGPSAVGGYLLKRTGAITRQGHCSDENQHIVFHPAMLDEVFGNEAADFGMLDGWMPIYVIRQRHMDACMEMLVYVSPGDPSNRPVIWVMCNWYTQSSHEKTRYVCVSDEDEEALHDIDPSVYWDAYTMAVQYWLDYRQNTARLDLPEKELEQRLYAALAVSSCTFTGAHPHYGHQQYSMGLHDNFPPNYLTMTETLWALGRLCEARCVVEHAFAYAVDACGRFSYRQGSRQLYGASGSDYGMWLWLVDRIEPSVGPQGWLRPYLNVLASMGDMLAGNVAHYPGEEGRRLLMMCPEADANGRVYAYMNNNLWASTGLAALGRLMNRYGMNGTDYSVLSGELLRSTLSAAGDEAVECRFGTLPPFRLGYPALPLTLSRCRDTAFPVDGAEYERYLRSSGIWEAAKHGQEYSENTYANYRYYLEMLSSSLLPAEWADSIVNMREHIGGELLGMTRFLDRLDDWPAANYARFLLSADRLEKYLLLLYAHARCHGSGTFANYYEQAGIDGKVYAPGCVPCQLLAPLMTAWMFCFEPVGEDSVYLLRGIPTRWYQTSGFSALGLGGSAAPLDLSVEIEPGIIRISVSSGEMRVSKDVYLDIHCAETITAAAIRTNGTQLLPTARKNRFLIEHKPGGIGLSATIRLKRSGSR